VLLEKRIPGIPPSSVEIFLVKSGLDLPSKHDIVLLTPVDGTVKIKVK